MIVGSLSSYLLKLPSQTFSSFRTFQLEDKLVFFLQLSELLQLPTRSNKNVRRCQRSLLYFWLVSLFDEDFCILLFQLFTFAFWFFFRVSCSDRLRTKDQVLIQDCIAEFKIGETRARYAGDSINDDKGSIVNGMWASSRGCCRDCRSGKFSSNPVTPCSRPSWSCSHPRNARLRTIRSRGY